MAGAITGSCRAKDWTFIRGEFVTLPTLRCEGGEVGEGEHRFRATSEVAPCLRRAWRVRKGMVRFEKSLPWRLPGSLWLPSRKDES
jgi:hypothetical protein